MFFNINSNLVFHSVAFLHTLILTAFRYYCMRWPLRARLTMAGRHPWKWSALTFLLTPILCGPVYFTSVVTEIQMTNETICSEPAVFDLTFVDNPDLVSANFWLFGILFKLIPCILLAVFSGLLVESLRQINIGKERRRSESIANIRSLSIADTRKFSTLQTGPAVRSRTTLLLVAIASCCFVVEFTHGVFKLLTGIFGTDFATSVYDPLGDFFEMLTLLYSSINFVLYCAMNTEFLRAFTELFCPKSLRTSCCSRTERAMSFALDVMQGNEEKGNIQKTATTETLLMAEDRNTHEIIMEALI